MNLKKLLLFVVLLSVVVTAWGARPGIVAHRGYWNTEGSAQNSIAALVKADSIGAQFSEFDVWLAGDGVPVLNHDASIGGYEIVSTPSTVLQQNVKLANGETIPTLAEFLERAMTLNIGLVLEVKWHADPASEARLIDMAINMVKERGLDGRTMYITFSPNAHAELGKHGVPHFYLTGISPDELAAMGSDGPDFQYEVYYKNPDFIPEFRRRGKPTNVWTPSTEEHLQYFIDHGIDYITTDDPVLALKLVEQTPSSVEVRIMDFNLEGAETYDAVGAIVYAEHPDFVTLQGINDPTALALIASRAGMYAYSAPAGRRDGVAILSTVPAVTTRSYILPNQFRTTDCAALVATFDMGHDIRVSVASASLSDDNAVSRNHQADFITRKLLAAGTPAVLGVGLNDDYRSQPFKNIAGKMYDVTPDGKTFPAPVPDRAIDFLFISTDDKVEEVQGYARPSSESFHYPIIKDLKIKR